MPYSYTHAYYGDSTELTYLRSRYYASGTGRFLTRDTWGGDANNPMSFNQWNYVDGNPINYTDPSGFVPCPPPYQTYNTCTIQDWYAYYGTALLQLVGVQVNNYHINIGDSSVNLTGYAFQESFEILNSTNQVVVPIADAGLSMMPGGGFGYDLAQIATGTNLVGYQYSPDERLILSIFGILGGLGDFGGCFRGLRFAPDLGGGGGFSSAGISTSKYQSRFLNAVDDFIEKSIKLHPRTSFGSTWRGWFTAASHDTTIANNLILASEGDELVGILRIQNGGREFPNALRLMDIEALNSNASISLIREAAQESIGRGFSGMYGYVTTAEGASFATRTGGHLLDSGSKLYYWDLETIYKLIFQ